MRFDLKITVGDDATQYEIQHAFRQAAQEAADLLRYYGPPELIEANMPIDLKSTMQHVMCVTSAEVVRVE